MQALLGDNKVLSQKITEDFVRSHGNSIFRDSATYRFKMASGYSNRRLNDQ